MSSSLRLCVFIVAVIIILVIIQILRKGRVPVKYSLVWFLSAIIIMLVSIFPNILEYAAGLIGFATISNMIIGVMIIILLFITMSLTIIVSGQKEKIRLLIQEISILKEKVDRSQNDK